MTLTDVEAKLNQLVVTVRANIGEDLDAAEFNNEPLRHCAKRAAVVREPRGAAVADVEGDRQRNAACYP
jgi:hypothetical protein